MMKPVLQFLNSKLVHTYVKITLKRFLVRVFKNMQTDNREQEKAKMQMSARKAMNAKCLL
jgi:hypothetical protein